MTERGYTIGEGGASAWVTRDELHDVLERAEVCAIESIPWSSNYTFAARLAAEGYPPFLACLLYTSPSPRDISGSRMPSSA